MSDTFSKVEVLTGVARRRRFPMEQKLAIVAETMQPGMSISYVARRHGLSPSLVFRWRRLMSEGGKEAIRADEDVVPASEARKLEEQVRELERLLGRKTMEVEILKEALDLARVKKPTLLSRLPSARRIPMKTIAETLEVARSNIIERAKGDRRSRGPQIRLVMWNWPPIFVGSSTSGRPTAIGGSPRSSSASGDPPARSLSMPSGSIV